MSSGNSSPQLVVLGAAREVGRSGLLLKGAKTRILMDFGVIVGKPPAFPIHVQPREIHGILLSHAHLDHSGALPVFYVADGVQLHCTPCTIELAHLLIEDFLQLSGFYLPYEYLDLMAMSKKTIKHPLHEPFTINDFTVTFYDAGHIPGSASILIEGEGKRILYTGDINSEDTALLRGAEWDFGELDMIICESTYGNVDHPPRERVEREFVSFAKEVVERGGVLLIPAFAVGRAQEIACVLREANFPYPVAMDGMALKCNEILLRYVDTIRDPDLLMKAIDGCKLIASRSERERMVKEPGVIIAPAGMLQGGAAFFYNSKIVGNPKNAVAIVSFQVPGTPGRTLLEKGLAYVRGKLHPIKAEVRRFEFSSHCGRSQLLKLFRKVKGAPKVVAVHGEAAAADALVEELRTQYGLEATAPEPGAILTI